MVGGGGGEVVGGGGAGAGGGRLRIFTAYVVKQIERAIASSG